MSEGKPATPATMSGMVYATLRRDILQGALPPAGKLRIEALCVRYGATSTPVREALNQLSTEGFVERRDQRGFYAAAASSTELEQLTNTRCWVEPIALREALARRTIAWEERVVLTCHRLSRVDRSTNAAEFRENPEWETAHRAFHLALIAICPSRWLIDFCALLSDHAARYRNLSMSVIYPARDIAGEHRALMEAAIHGRAEEATALLVEHYRRTAQIIENSPSKPLGDPAQAPRKRKSA